MSVSSEIVKEAIECVLMCETSDEFNILRWLFAEYEEARAEEAMYELREEAEQGTR